VAIVYIISITGDVISMPTLDPREEFGMPNPLKETDPRPIRFPTANGGSRRGAHGPWPLDLDAKRRELPLPQGGRGASQGKAGRAVGRPVLSGRSCWDGLFYRILPLCPASEHAHCMDWVKSAVVAPVQGHQAAMTAKVAKYRYYVGEGGTSRQSSREPHGPTSTRPWRIADRTA
jgi:hypothetical protein